MVRVFGVYCDNEMVGITAITIHDREKPHDAYLSQSFIRQPHRGKGLSKMLYEARLQWARTHNVHRLVVGHKETNQVSKNANQNFGFTYTHSESRLWPDGSTADMLYYELAL
jgi:GNAT superfamily N-acetyltransferase